MFAYWILFSAYAVGAIGHKLRPQSDTRRFVFFELLALATVLFVGLRYRVGADWINYQAIFDMVRDQDWGELAISNDPGYMLLNRFAGELDLGIWFVNLVCAAIFMGGLAQFARRQPNPWLAVLIAVPYLIIVVGMGYTRQAAAIGFLFAAIGRFERHSYVRFVLLIVVGALFHKSLVVVVPLIVLAAVRHRFLVYATAAAIAMVVILQFLDVLLSFVTTTYLDTELTSSGAGIRVAMNVLPAILFLLFQRRFIVSELERTLWRNFSIAALIVAAALFALPSSTLVDRIALYLIPLQIFVLSRLPYAFPVQKRENLQLTVLVLLYSAAIQFVWLSYAGYARYWLPYRNYLLD